MAATAKAETEQQKRWKAYERVQDLLKPYLGRCIAEFHDKQKNAVYIFLLCSKEADAGDNRHQWRGTVTVNITKDGSAHFSIGENLVMQALKRFSETGSSPVFDYKNAGTWEATELLLDMLVPPLPVEA